MKKRFIYMFTLLFSILFLVSCNLSFSDPNVTIDKIFDENTITTTIQTTVSKAVSKVEKGCVGILAEKNVSKSIGSGVIYKIKDNLDKNNNVISKTYYVVTNEHVITNSDKIKIYLGHEVYVPCDKVGSDSVNDLAVLTFTAGVDEYDLIANEISKEVRIPSIGSYCIAIGCPLTLDYFNYVTLGTIGSCTASKIHHSAEINPGNSGGGLFDIDGTLIGINVKKTFYVNQGDDRYPVDGIAETIPAWIVEKVCKDIESNNPILKRTSLGISTININTMLKPEMADYLPNIINVGVMCNKVVENSNASNMEGTIDGQDEKVKGLLPRDIIHTLYYKGEEITLEKGETLKSYINTLVVGDNLKLGVYRKVEGSWINITFSVSLK